MAHPPGTVFVLRSGGLVGRTIRLLTRSRYNHAGVCVGDGFTVEAQAAGAVSKREQDPSPRLVYGTALHARIEHLAPGRGKRIAEEARHLIGTGYNFLDLVALAYAGVTKDPAEVPDKPAWWQRRVMDDHRLICSQLADLAHLNAGVHLFIDGRLPGQVNPGDLHEVLTNPEWPIHVDL